MTTQRRLSPLNTPTSGRHKLAICGFGHGAEHAPWNDPAYDVWGCNADPWPYPPLFRDDKHRLRADQWWQIHPLCTWNKKEHAWFDTLHLSRIPTVVLADEVDTIKAAYPAVPDSLLIRYYPDDARRAFPHGLFASTFCLQFAAAIQYSYDEIVLYGAECRDLGRELVVERPANVYWLGVAHTMGIAAHFAEPSTLGHHPYTYGADFAQECRFAADITEQVLPPDVINQEGNLNTRAMVEAFLETRPALTRPSSITKENS